MEIKKKIIVRTSGGIVYKATVEKNTLEEVADYLTNVKWIKTNNGCIVYTAHINLLKKEK